MRSLQKLKKRQSGFTIVELLIVIVVIGILAALVITTYAGIQAKARNSKRQTDIQDIQTQLEAYFQDKGDYPTYDEMSDASWVSSNMKSLDQKALVDPQQGTPADGKTGIANAPATKVYSYQPLNDSGTACSDETDCVSYTLTAKLESGGGDYVKKNLD